MKRPAFQFYPEKWQTDKALRLCSIGARGLWIELMGVMHQCEPYGHLTDEVGGAMPDQDAAKLCGVERAEFKRLLAEIERRGVSSRTPDGILCSRRMVRDEVARNARAEGGKAGAEHGAKGAEFGAKGGRPTKERGVLNPPSESDEKPPSKPPPVFVSESVSLKPAVGVTPTIDARAGDSHGTGSKNGKANGKHVESWQSSAWVSATAKTIGIERRKGEADSEFADRVHTAVETRKRQAAAEARKRAT